MFINFKKRIQNWSEADVVREIDVRKLKISQAEREEKKAKARRLNSELNALSERLVVLRNLSLWPEPKADASLPLPANQNAS